MTNPETTIMQRELFISDIVAPQATNPRVIAAFRQVDRAHFAPRQFRSEAYDNRALPIEAGRSSISSPEIVATMLDALNLTGEEKVLEIGTATGYNAALLSHVAKEVHTIEYDAKLAKNAQKRLHKLGYTNITVHIGDGLVGIPHEAPFDRIVVTAGATAMPENLVSQLCLGGTIVIPIGEKAPSGQKLIRGTRASEGMTTEIMREYVSFVPIISGEHGGWTKDDIEAAEKKFRQIQEEQKRELAALREQIKAIGKSRYSF